MTGTCFLCGNYETVERHHIFQGALRKKADKLKLTVYLCPWCHQYDADSVHRSGETRLILHKYGQRRAMIEQGWSKEDFIREFGKNYLSDQEIAEMYDTQEISGHFELIRDEVELPW